MLKLIPNVFSVSQNKGANGQHVWRTEPDIVTEKELPVLAYYTGKENGTWISIPCQPHTVTSG